jgi:protein O-GlcNAc transferase
MQTDAPERAIRDYFTGIELVIQSPAAEHSPYSMREFILACFVACYIIMSTPSRPLPDTLVACLPEDITAMMTSSKFDFLQCVRSSGDDVLHALLRLGRNVLPFLLLHPEQVSRLPTVLFPYSKGVLPALCTLSNDISPELLPPPEATRRQTNLMTGNIVLALAKYYQDLPSSSVSIPGFSGLLNVNHALAIMFYYLALSLSPSPSTYNNMGIILSTVSDTTSWTSNTGECVTLSGSDLAKIFYTEGLKLDPSHPHLLTNLGSLYKDRGNIETAIQYVTSAVELASRSDFI